MSSRRERKQWAKKPSAAPSGGSLAPCGDCGLGGRPGPSRSGIFCQLCAEPTCASCLNRWLPSSCPPDLYVALCKEGKDLDFPFACHRCEPDANLPQQLLGAGLNLSGKGSPRSWLLSLGVASEVLNCQPGEAALTRRELLDRKVHYSTLEPAAQRRELKRRKNLDKAISISSSEASGSESGASPRASPHRRLYRLPPTLPPHPATSETSVTVATSTTLVTTAAPLTVAAAAPVATTTATTTSSGTDAALGVAARGYGSMPQLLRPLPTFPSAFEARLPPQTLAGGSSGPSQLPGQSPATQWDSSAQWGAQGPLPTSQWTVPIAGAPVGQHSAAQQSFGTGRPLESLAQSPSRPPHVGAAAQAGAQAPPVALHRPHWPQLPHGAAEQSAPSVTDPPLHGQQGGWASAQAQLFGHQTLQSQVLQRLMDAQPQRGFYQPLQLPKVKIPSFSGKQRDWLQWWNQFSGRVDSNPALSEHGKMDCLTEALEGGTAAASVEGYMGLGSGYRGAVQTLHKLYANPFLMRDSLWQDLEHCPNIHDHCSNITEIYDAMKAAVQMLLHSGEAACLLDTFAQRYVAKQSQAVSWQLLFPRRSAANLVGQPWTMAQLLNDLDSLVTLNLHYQSAKDTQRPY